MSTENKTSKEMINGWFLGKRDYKTGLILLEVASPNSRALLKHLKRAETIESKQHLAYQLFKISDHIDENICNAEVVSEIENTDNLSDIPHPDLLAVGPETILEENGISAVEKILLAKLVERQKKYYNLRAVAFKKMKLLGNDNSQAIIEERQDYLAIISDCTAIVDFLYYQKMNWLETSVAPDVSILTWIPEIESEHTEVIPVNEIPPIDLNVELSKVRSRLSKYDAKIKNASAKKLDELLLKKESDEKLKADLISQIKSLKSK
ncbi:MAG: hypothetical protein ACOYOV_06310 [Bacteroidales bacterium]